MLALALTAVSAAADDDLPPLTLLDYDLLISGHDYSAEVAAAYSKDGLGILAVVGAPNSTIESPRRRLLQLAHTLATSPSEKLAAYERPELSYASGWSLGRETFKGKPDMSKGSWYAHALEDDPGAGDPSAHRYPLLTPTNIWPSALVGDDFEAAFKELSRGLYDLSAHVLRNADAYVEATNPSAPKGALLRSTHERSRLHVGRLLHYYAPNASDDAPAGGAGGAAEESDEDSGWCGWHNDNSVITCLPPALWLDEQTGEPIAAEECPAGGLVVRTRKGRRVGVQVPRGAILFQLGEAAQIISGGLLMATPHAVRKGGAQRAPPPPTRTTRPLSPRPPRPTPTPTHLTTPHHPRSTHAAHGSRGHLARVVRALRRAALGLPDRRRRRPRRAARGRPRQRRRDTAAREAAQGAARRVWQVPRRLDLRVLQSRPEGRRRRLSRAARALALS